MQISDELLLALLKRLTAMPESEDDEEEYDPVVARLDRLEEALLAGMKRSRSRTFGSNY